MTQPESWLPVPGYEGWYEVSCLGRVRSVTRTVQTRLGSRTYKGRVLKQYIAPSGYAAVTLAKGGVCRDWFVHRLVLQAFVGEPPEGTECCHANDVRGDNRLENLRWDTHEANVRDTTERGRVRNQNTGKTHCKRGHEFDDANTYVDGRGNRMCKACSRLRNRGELVA